MGLVDELCCRKQEVLLTNYDILLAGRVQCSVALVDRRTCHHVPAEILPPTPTVAPVARPELAQGQPLTVRVDRDRARGVV